jgi:predicted DNA-binding protein
MGETITFRLDAETHRILRDLMDRKNGTKSQVIKEALREHWTSLEENSRPTAWEVYSKLKIPPARGPKRDRARNAKKLIREMLLAKRRNGTL